MNNTFFEQLIGLHADSDTITAGQMCARSVIVFLVALALLRLAGTRTFANGTAFDIVLKIILGAVLSRAVVASSPFFGTLLASMVFVVLHRLLALAAYYNNAVGRLVKGRAKVLVQHGRHHQKNLRRASITANDLTEALRENGYTDELIHDQTVHLERNGKISVVTRQPHQQDEAEAM
ncbi:DUF421 domain-containing protein [Hymenobacter sp. BT175]|uniref:DUF421 domain-containing protein n=1 Tax=Hymenobacter translucens TaxID=2886507 RepID=UPI001D0E4EA3|nr:YetF domain-containing protein [Hymenobacter translucens]MCC2548269.1 DUF421 domain-containing protein [Hymenobacter translucens]